LKTEELISLLVRDLEAIEPAQNRRRFILALLAGNLMAVGVSVGILRVNPTLSHLVLEPMFWVRESFCFALGLTGIVALRRLGRPGRRLGLVPFGVAAPVVVLWVLAAFAVQAAPPSARVPLILGRTARACPFLITLLAVPPFAAFVWMSRGPAPTHLRLTGAAAGLAAGALGAQAYTLHCPELAAPFIGVWYLLGMLIPTALGAWLGPRLLRW
jgi:hypothetical protein